MFSAELLAILLTGIGLTASIIYYANTIRNAEKARQRELVFQRFHGYSLDYHRAYNSVATQLDWETPEEWERKYGRFADIEAFSQFTYITGLFNLAGVTFTEKITDLDLIFKLYPPSSIIRVWEQFEPVYEYIVHQVGNPDYLPPFNALYIEAKKRYPDVTTRRTYPSNRETT